MSYRGDHGGGHFRLRITVFQNFRHRHRWPPKIDEPGHHDYRRDQRSEQAKHRRHAHRGHPERLQ